MITAEEAFRIGLVNEVLPASDLIVRAQAILKQIASNAPIAKLSCGLEVSSNAG
jgi:enoyl-CoA hydratase